MKITNNDLFYCYSLSLHKFLNTTHNLTPLTVAINPKTGRKFSLYQRDSDLKRALDEYNQI